MAKSSTAKPKRSFQNPKGTRDFFPEDQLRQRYITDSWRRVALRHGFDEIDGPTFEHLNLYTVKSGEGIVSELFSFQRHGGDDTYALRPEFTPTLARMYAARAKQLPTPVKWFSICNYFRAERPQRGRLREFMQLNCDVIGLGGREGSNAEDAEGEERKKAEAEADGELDQSSDILLLDVLSGTLDELSLSPHRKDSVCIKVSSRQLLGRWLAQQGVEVDRQVAVLSLLDRATKLDPNAVTRECESLQLAEPVAHIALELAGEATGEPSYLKRLRGLPFDPPNLVPDELRPLALQAKMIARGNGWEVDPFIVRGLAYYTGTVFEAIAEGERAVAGGGRYDNLIELMGGPPTPAAGFAMGDVVLGNILDDKGLIPDGRELLEALSRPMPVRPDVFVVAANDEAKQQVVPLVARLQRGVEADDASDKKPWDASRYAIAPLHARRSYRSFTTKNLGKIQAKHLSDASSCHARFCVTVKDDQTCNIKDLDLQQQTTKPVPLDTAHEVIASGDLSRHI